MLAEGWWPALLTAVDYLSRIPVVGLTGMLPEDQQGCEAAIALGGTRD